MDTQNKTFLYEEHVKLGGKMIDFAGKLLPARYVGIKEEHLAVRNDAGMFDISHMGVLILEGEKAFDFLQKVITNDVNKTLSHKMVYGMILNQDGNILDDIMVGCIQDNKFILIVNAANKAKIMAWLNTQNKDQVKITDQAADYGLLAVQGPNAAQKLSTVLGADFNSPARFSISEMTIMGVNTMAMRSGYTGEDGYELLLHKTIIENVWDSLVKGGVTSCGLGARDTLRLEAGLPLYGQELCEKITPLETRYPWVIAWNTDFIGKEVLLKQKETPKNIKTVGIMMNERIIPRTGYSIQEGGHITSGTLSPVLDKPIGMAFVSPENSVVGTPVTVIIRNKPYVAQVVDLPFVKKGK
ncbi:glycine cleavage system aminomethyltransferase GcvT [Thermoproteota archaeon]